MAFLFLVPVIIIGVVLFFWFRKSNIKIIIPQPLPSEGFSIPVKDTYYGTFEHNGGFGYFKLFDDYFEVRALNSYKFLYKQVKDVGYFEKFGGNVEVVITFNGNENNFSAFINKNNLKQVLMFFKGKGCKMSSKTESFIAG